MASFAHKVFATIFSKLITKLQKLSVFKIETDSFFFRIFVSNSHELYRATSFSTKEPDTLLFMLFFSDQPNVSLIDVGANIGIYSLAFASRSLASVYAFEFDPSSLSSLIKNITLNNFSNVIPIQLSLCASPGLNLLRTFYNLFEPGAGAGGLNQPYAATKDQSDQFSLTLTPSSSLDHVESISGFPSQCVLKIDTDGHELDILNGASQLLSSGKVLAAIIEINTACYSESQINEILFQHSFALVGRSKWTDLTISPVYNCVYLHESASPNIFSFFSSNPSLLPVF